MDQNKSKPFVSATDCTVQLSVYLILPEHDKHLVVIANYVLLCFLIIAIKS